MPTIAKTRSQRLSQMAPAQARILRRQRTRSLLGKGYRRVLVADHDPLDSKGLDCPVARTAEGAVRAITVEYNKILADHHHQGHWQRSDFTAALNEEHGCWEIAVKEESYCACPAGYAASLRQHAARH